VDFDPLEHSYKPEDLITEDRVAALCQLIVESFNFLIYNEIITGSRDRFFPGVYLRSLVLALCRLLFGF